MTETMNRAKIHKDRHDEWYTPQSLLRELLGVLCHTQKGSTSPKYFDPCSSKNCYDRLPEDMRPHAFLDKEGRLWHMGECVQEGLETTPDAQTWLQICQMYDINALWCNPPFSKGKEFINAGVKLSLIAKTPIQMLYLLPANTEAIWFQDCIEMCYANEITKTLVFLRRRVQFFDGFNNLDKSNNSGGNIIVPICLDL